MFSMTFLFKVALRKAPSSFFDLLPGSTPYAPVADNKSSSTIIQRSVSGERNNENDDDGSKGVIRFDLKFPVTVKDGKPREIWIDHAIVQETSPTHATNTLNFLEKDVNHLPENSPAFTKTYGGKVRRYK